MAKRVLIMDTSILCCLIEVPGKETCGSGIERWDKARVDKLLSNEQQSTLVLPLATIIETGNHIAHAPRDRFNVASRFSEYLAAAADGSSPWAAFTEQAVLWGSDQLRELARTWPKLAAAETSIGDATIASVEDFYARASFDVEILTGDAGLKSYQPAVKPVIPRRRGG